MTNNTAAAKLAAIAEATAKLSETITKSEANVLVGGAAGLPVQQATGYFRGFKVVVRVNIGAEVWFVIGGYDSNGVQAGYTGTDAMQAITTLIS